MAVVIQMRGLTRSYQTYKKAEGVWNSVKGFWSREVISKTALHPTDLEISDGQIVGLVGANGAGKTTLIKILSGLIHPSGGEATVLGFHPWKRQSEYLSQMSVLLGQKNQLWWDIPAADSYDLLAKIYSIPPATARKRVAELSELLRCEDLLKIQLRRLSLGERMKMEIIGALLHHPRVLFLDEPTIGLDVLAQATIREFISKYVREYRPTVLLTSHYMDDIARLADQLLLISQGTIVYNGTVDGFIRQSERQQKILIRLTEPIENPIELPTGAVLEAGVQDFELILPASQVGSVMTRLTQKSEIQALSIEESDFEDVIHRFLEKESRPL